MIKQRQLSQRERMAYETIAKLEAKLAERDALLRELAEAAEVFSCSAHCETSDAGDALDELNKNLARVNAHRAPKCRVCGHKLHAEGYCSFRDCGVPGRGTKALSDSAEPNAPIKMDPLGQPFAQILAENAEGLMLKAGAPKCQDGGMCEGSSHKCDSCAPVEQQFRNAVTTGYSHPEMFDMPVERDEREEFESWVETRKVCTHKGAKLHKDRAGSYLDYRINDRWLTWQARAALERKP